MNTSNDNMNEKLIAYLDGELNADEIMEVESYLEQNPSAMAEMESLFEVRELLNSHSTPAPPAGLTADIIAKARFAERNAPTGFIRLTLFAATVLIGLMAWTVVLDDSKNTNVRRNIANVETNKNRSTLDRNWNMDDDEISEEECEESGSPLEGNSVRVTGMAKSVVTLADNKDSDCVIGTLGDIGLKKDVGAPPGGRNDNLDKLPESPKTGEASGDGSTNPSDSGYATRGGGTKDKAAPEKMHTDADKPMADDAKAEEKKNNSEIADEPASKLTAEEQKEQIAELTVKNLGKATLWFTTNDSTLVFKGGSLEISTLKPLAVKIPSFGLLELAANSTLRITLYDYAAQKVVELPGLVLKSSAEKCSIQFHLITGSAVFTRNVCRPVTLGEPGGWVFDIDGHDHEYVD